MKVLDFGLVKNVADTGEDLTQTGMFMGSPKYMSPEQIRGDRVDGRADVYALGIILYEMLTGKVPFDRATSVNILMAHVHDEAPSMRETNPLIAVSSALEEIVARCLAKDPAHRLGSMGEVLEALKAAGAPSATGTIGTIAIADRNSAAPSGSGPRSSFTPDGLRSSAPRPSLPSDIPAASAPLVAQVVGRLKGMLVAAIGGRARRGGGDRLRRRPAGEGRRGRGIRDRARCGACVGPAASAAPVAPTQLPVAPPEPPQLFTVRVTSEPEGATVREDSVEVCASTPCEIAYKGVDVDPGRDHKLTLARQGYRVETRSVKPGDAPVVVKLSPLPRGMPAPAPRPAEAPSVPTGYKPDIPY